jgi:hypothetical protein
MVERMSCARCNAPNVARKIVADLTVRPRCSPAENKLAAYLPAAVGLSKEEACEALPTCADWLGKHYGIHVKAAVLDRAKINV